MHRCLYVVWSGILGLAVTTPSQRNRKPPTFCCVLTLDAQRADELINEVDFQVVHVQALGVVPLIASIVDGDIQPPTATAMEQKSAHLSQAIMTLSSS